MLKIAPYVLAALLIANSAHAEKQTIATGHDYLIYCGALADNKVLNNNSNDTNFCLTYISLLFDTSFKPRKHLNDQDVKIVAVYYINYLVAHPDLLDKNNSLIFPHIFDY